MGSKKRSLGSVVEEEEEAQKLGGENPKEKKMKKEKKPKDGLLDAVKPMETEKKRRAFDKERRGAAASASGKDETAWRPKGGVGKSSVSEGLDNGLPKFHIDVFRDLAAADVAVRSAALARLVSELCAVQGAYERVEDRGLAEGGLKLEAEKDDGLNDCAPSVRYAVRRLIRGASSSRECARQGFALGLSLLVSTIPSIKLDSLLKLIVDLLEVSSSMKGQEAKDCLLGRLFTYGAIARSRRLVREWNSDHSMPYIKELTGHLISLASKKRYLQEPAVAIIVDLVEQIPSEAVAHNILDAPGVREWFESATETGNPDALFLALKIQEKVPALETTFGKILPNPFSPSRLLSSDHLSLISNCLKESTFCQPRVHSVWHILVNILLPETIVQLEDVVTATNSLKKLKKGRRVSSSEEEIANGVKNFSEVIIEGSLLLSSHDRKHLALDILLLLLPRLPASLVPIVLSYKLVQCLVDILATRESWLHKVGQHFLKELSKWVENDDVRRVAVIVALQKHSNGRFDSITRTKTIKMLVEGFKTESGCLLFIQNLTNIFVDDGHASDEPSDQSQTTDDNSEIGSVEDKDLANPLGNPESLRIWMVEALPNIQKHLKLEPDATLRVHKEILKFLAVQCLFSATLGSEVTSFELHETFTWPKAAVSSTICKLGIEQIQLLLASAQKMEGSHTFSSSPESYDLGSFFMRFLSTLRSIPSVSLFRSLSVEDEEAFTNLQEMDAELSREERNHVIAADTKKLHSLRYLLIQLLLQVLLRPGEFAEAATDLIMCCKKAFPPSEFPGSSGEDESEDNAAPELIDVLVDTLLSLLPQSSAAMRSAIEQVFKYFCSDVTHGGLLRMLQIIKKDLKPARHRTTESDDEDSEDEDMLAIEEEEFDDGKTGETGESEEQTDDSEAINEGDIAPTEKHEDSDDSDSGMDDDAMFRMDTYLARIFQEKKNQAGGEGAQSQLVLFKLRVLSLLEIYLHENPGKNQVLIVYSNLAQVLVNPHTAEISDQLAQRIWGILQKKVFKAKDFPKCESAQLPTLESLLEKNLKLASKPLKRKKSANTLSQKKLSALKLWRKMISSLAQNSTFWLLKIVDASNFSESESQRVLDIFKGALLAYFDSKKSQLKPEFLKEVFHRRPWIGQNLLGFLLEKIASAKLDFRRVEALDLVMEVVKSLLPSSTDESNRSSSKKILKVHLQKLACLVKELVTNMPEKQSRRAEARKFCGKVFQIVSTHDLTKPFLKELVPEAQAACESQLGQMFLNFKKPEKNDKNK